MAARTFSRLQPEQSSSEYIKKRRNRANFQDVKEQAVTHNQTVSYNGDAQFTSTQVTKAKNYETLFSLSHGRENCNTCAHSPYFQKKNAESQFTQVTLTNSEVSVREIGIPDVDNSLDNTANNTYIDPDNVLFNSPKEFNPYLSFVTAPTKDLSDNYVNFDFPNKITF